MLKLAFVPIAFIGMLGIAPASALPITSSPAGAENSLITSVAWYCDGRGHCIQSRRKGYIVRGGWVPPCYDGRRWDGYRCIGGATIVIRRHDNDSRRPGIVIRGRDNDRRDNNRRDDNRGGGEDRRPIPGNNRP